MDQDPIAAVRITNKSPDDPIEDNPHDTYDSFQLPVRSPSLREPNLMTHSTKVEDDDVPRVIDVTPDPRMLTPTPTTEDLVRRYGGEWTELKEEKWELKDG